MKVKFSCILRRGTWRSFNNGLRAKTKKDKNKFFNIDYDADKFGCKMDIRMGDLKWKVKIMEDGHSYGK